MTQGYSKGGFDCYIKVSVLLFLLLHCPVIPALLILYEAFKSKTKVEKTQQCLFQKSNFNYCLQGAIVKFRSSTLKYGRSNLPRSPCCELFLHCAVYSWNLLYNR